MIKQWVFLTLMGIFLVGCGATPVIPGAGGTDTPSSKERTKEKANYGKAVELYKRIKNAQEKADELTYTK